MLLMAKAGRLNGYLLEGMACPGGCVAGAGTLQPINKSSALVKKYATESDKKDADESAYGDRLHELSEHQSKTSLKWTSFFDIIMFGNEV